MELQMLEVKFRKSKSGSTGLINESDFDEKLHELIAKVPMPEEAVTKQEDAPRPGPELTRVPTMRVKLKKSKTGAEAVINAEDFDKKLHEVIEEPAAEEVVQEAAVIDPAVSTRVKTIEVVLKKSKKGARAFINENEFDSELHVLASDAPVDPAQAALNVLIEKGKDVLSKMLKDLKVDKSVIVGTGNGGNVVKEDLARAVLAATKATADGTDVNEAVKATNPKA
jgi:hypothetical protein